MQVRRAVGVGFYKDALVKHPMYWLDASDRSEEGKWINCATGNIMLVPLEPCKIQLGKYTHTHTHTDAPTYVINYE